jgi:cyclohexanone monooxygenase
MNRPVTNPGTRTAPRSKPLDAIVVGAGFGGLYMLHSLRDLGLHVRGFEAGEGVGGTWYWNRYPGARCDVQSMEYSYQFSDELAQEWQWTERYAGQPEILRYLDHVADRFDLRSLITFDTRVTNAVFDDDMGRWSISTNDEAVDARFCIMATGCLSSANQPEFPGLDTFEGEVYHTGEWPHQPVDFSGKRVAIIGTGSSGIQATPVVAEAADQLYVMQRTPNFSVPAGNGPLSDDEQDAIKGEYRAFRARQRVLPIACQTPPRRQSALEPDDVEREALLESYWQQGGLSFLSVFNDLLVDKAANDVVAAFIRRKIAEVVEDAQVASKLSPDHVFGCKRPCSDTGYYEAFNRDNVTLVDVESAPITGMTVDGVRTGDALYQVDSIIFATGFDAMTGALNRIDIRGRGGLALTRKWAAGPRAYLGLATAGFPNLFIMTGPGSPSVLANMVTGLEQHAEWITECIGDVMARRCRTVEPSIEAEDEWVEYVNKMANRTLYPTCNSWYMGANIPGKPRIFMPFIGGFPAYERACKEVVADDYRGFEFG